MCRELPESKLGGGHEVGMRGSLEKDMATHSSILVWRIPWTEERGWLLSKGSQRVRHD